MNEILFSQEQWDHLCLCLKQNALKECGLSQGICSDLHTFPPYKIKTGMYNMMHQTIPREENIERECLELALCYQEQHSQYHHKQPKHINDAQGI